MLGHVAREIRNAPPGLTRADLTDFLWRRRTTDPNDDVPDPYRRGKRAAAIAARAVDGFLDVVVARLLAMPYAGT